MADVKELMWNVQIIKIFFHVGQTGPAVLALSRLRKCSQQKESKAFHWLSNSWFGSPGTSAEKKFASSIAFFLPLLQLSEFHLWKKKKEDISDWFLRFLVFFSLLRTPGKIVFLGNLAFSIFFFACVRKKSLVFNENIFFSALICSCAFRCSSNKLQNVKI